MKPFSWDSPLWLGMSASGPFWGCVSQMKQVTIQDIARVAKVSKSTVSRVLNDSAYVHPKKKAAVLEATRRLGFKPNVVARSLAHGRSMTIGVLTQLIGSPYYDAISQGVIEELAQTTFAPIFVDGQWQERAEIEGIRALMGRHVDGLILIGGGISGATISDICGQLPTVVVGRELPGDRHVCFYADNELGGYLATSHLLEQGHRQIAIIKGLKHQPDAIDRWVGFNRAMREAGWEPDPDLVIQGDFSPESGVQAVEQLLAQGKDFTAIVAANDMTAFGARLALDRAGLNVPADVSVVGFDDQLESTYWTPPLTTIRQPAQEMGRLAANAVVEIVNGQSPVSQCLPCTLVKRDSVAIPSAD